MAWKLFSSRQNQARHTPIAAESPASYGAVNTLTRMSPKRTDDVVFIARQAVCNATERVVGFELMVRPSGLLPERIPGSESEGSELLINALNRFGVARALGDKLGFMQLGAGTLESDLVELLPQDRFVLEYPSSYLASAAAAERCKGLQAQGFLLARVCQPGDMDVTDISGTAGYVVYDLAFHTLQDIVRIDRGAKQAQVERLVRNVNTRADFDACKTFGFDYYQGNFFAHPETLSMNRLDPSRARVMDIFNLVINRADVAEIEAAFKHDVALCYSLLCYINSVGIGLQYKVSSIRDAVMLLGYDFLWRWLSLLIFAGVDLTAAQRVLLNTAVIRGRLTELLGQGKLDNREGNFLFIVGIFSMLDVLLGVPLKDVLGKLSLPEEVSRALLAREGKYASYLDLTLAFESNNLAAAERLCSDLGIDLSAASQSHVNAIEWANVLAQ
jgi:EAL and modified HD-GYP domain-containing signal transduction protein